MEGLPPARYPVSKTGGSHGLGGSTPSPSSRLEAWPSPARQRVASAQAARAARRFESCCLRHRPVAQRRRAVGFDPTSARSNRAGVSMCTMRRRSTAGRPAVTRRMLVRPQPSQPHVRFRPRSSSSVEDSGLSHRRRGFESRSGHLLRHALGRVWDMRPGCLPGEAGSIPVESAPRRSSMDERRAPTAGDGGSTPPGETASQGL